MAISVRAENVAQIACRISGVPRRARKELNAEAQRSKGAETFTAGNRGNGARNSVFSVYSCSNLRTRVMGENIIEAGPVVELLDQPHPTMDRALFFEMLMTWRALRGEFFILPLDEQDQPVELGPRDSQSQIANSQGRGKSRIRRLITLAPEMFWHVVSRYELQGRHRRSPGVPVGRRQT